jgi:hypothetical protein
MPEKRKMENLGKLESKRVQKDNVLWKVMLRSKTARIRNFWMGPDP